MVMKTDSQVLDLRLQTIEAACEWVGQQEQGMSVVSLRRRYASCWQWEPGEWRTMDWCLAWALTMCWAGLQDSLPAHQRVTTLDLRYLWPDRWMGRTSHHPVGRWDGSTRHFLDRASSAGLIETRPMSGAIVAWPRRGHVGLVASVNATTIRTIEGNVSDAVGRRSHPVGAGAVYVRWWDFGRTS